MTSSVAPVAHPAEVHTNLLIVSSISWHHHSIRMSRSGVSEAHWLTNYTNVVKGCMFLTCHAVLAAQISYKTSPYSTSKGCFSGSDLQVFSS